VEGSIPASTTEVNLDVEKMCQPHKLQEPIDRLTGERDLRLVVIIESNSARGRVLRDKESALSLGKRLPVSSA